METDDHVEPAIVEALEGRRSLGWIEYLSNVGLDDLVHRVKSLILKDKWVRECVKTYLGFDESDKAALILLQFAIASFNELKQRAKEELSPRPLLERVAYSVLKTLLIHSQRLFRINVRGEVRENLGSLLNTAVECVIAIVRKSIWEWIFAGERDARGLRMKYREELRKGLENGIENALADSLQTLSTEVQVELDRANRIRLVRLNMDIGSLEVRPLSRKGIGLGGRRSARKAYNPRIDPNQ